MLLSKWSRNHNIDAAIVTVIKKKAAKICSGMAMKHTCICGINRAISPSPI